MGTSTQASKYRLKGSPIACDGSAKQDSIICASRCIKTAMDIKNEPAW